MAPAVACGALTVVLLVVIVIVAAVRVGSASSVTSTSPAAPPPQPPSAPLFALGAALPPASEPLTFFAHGSCADQKKPQRVWPTILSLRPDLFVFNGDLVYGDCLEDGCPELTSAWSDLFRIPTFQQAAAELAMTGILDDHDYGQNDAFSANPHKGFAKDLFLERFAVGPDDARRRRDGLYTAHTFGPEGRRTQIILLDTRWFRSPFVGTDCRNCPLRERYLQYNASESARHTILGEAQWQWLERVLRQPADVRLIVSTIQILATGHGWERWGLVPTEVSRLVRLIGSTAAQGVVLISGDRHSGGRYRLPRGVDDAPYDLIEVTASSLTHSYRPPGEPLAEDEPAQTAAQFPAGAIRDGPMVHHNNFGTVGIDWERRTLTLDLRASDDCGLAPQAWNEVCTAHNGTAGNVLDTLTVSLHTLRV